MNSPEYTTSAPVIGPLIMCSGFVVSAKPYHARHRIASSSSRRRVASVDPSFHRARLVSRLVSSHHPHASSSRIIITHPHPHHHLSRQKSRSRRLGRVVSRVARTASTNPQFATGPQKCVVFGPVGPLMKARIDMIPRPSRRALPSRGVPRHSSTPHTLLSRTRANACMNA
jgi:hypothetical protein